MQSGLALHPPLASLDPPRRRVTKPDDLSGRGEEDVQTGDIGNSRSGTWVTL